MTALDGIETTLRRWGVPVLTDDVVAGRPDLFTPTHVMVHHTASAPGRPNPSARIVRTGRPDVQGPLCQLLVRRDLKVELVTRGRANHAGTGGPWGGVPRDSGNRFMVGIEIEHAGTDAEPWTPTYMAFCRVVAAASLAHIRGTASHLLAHKEWTSRKIDPYGWNMPAERVNVTRLLAAGPPPADTDLLEELMSLDRNSADYKAFVADVADAVVARQRPILPYVKALYADADGAMSLEQAAQHAAGQAFAANKTAGTVLGAVQQVQSDVAALRSALPPVGI